MKIFAWYNGLPDLQTKTIQSMSRTLLGGKLELSFHFLEPQLPENSIAGEVRLTATGTDKLPDFQYGFTLWGLYKCNSGSFHLLTFFKIKNLNSYINYRIIICKFIIKIIFIVLFNIFVSFNVFFISREHFSYDSLRKLTSLQSSEIIYLTREQIKI